MIRSKTVNLDDDVERLLIVSDLHSHLEPLEAFEEVRAKFTDRARVLFNGDAFYGGPRPVESAEWIMANAGELATLGNHDVKMIETEATQAAPGEPASPFTEAGAYTLLSESQREYFRNLTHRLDVHWHGHRIALMHGHVNVENKPVPWISSPSEQASNFAERDVDLFVLSHSHWPYEVSVEGMRVANTGSLSLTSVGVIQDGGALHLQSGEHELADDGGDNRSSFLSVTETSGKLTVEIVRFDYDRHAALDDLERAGGTDLVFRRRWMLDGVMVLS